MFKKYIKKIKSEDGPRTCILTTSGDSWVRGKLPGRKGGTPEGAEGSGVIRFGAHLQVSAWQICKILVP